MKSYKIINVDKDIEIASDVLMASGFFARLKGLMGKKELANNAGIIIKPCNSIHTFGMKIAIDVVFVDKDNRVIFIIENMQPKKTSPIIKGSKFVIELNAKMLKDKLAIGDKICLIEN